MKKMANGNGNGNGSGNGIKLTVANVLQAIIIGLLSIIGWVLANQNDSLREIDQAVGSIQVDQAVIKAKLVQNDKEHQELKRLIKEYEK